MDILSGIPKTATRASWCSPMECPHGKKKDTPFFVRVKSAAQKQNDRPERGQQRPAPSHHESIERMIWYCRPHRCISSRMGLRLFPVSVIEYSTRGGTSA